MAGRKDSKFSMFFNQARADSESLSRFLFPLPGPRHSFEWWGWSWRSPRQNKKKRRISWTVLRDAELCSAFFFVFHTVYLLHDLHFLTLNRCFPSQCRETSAVPDQIYQYCFFRLRQIIIFFNQTESFIHPAAFSWLEVPVAALVESQRQICSPCHFLAKVPLRCWTSPCAWRYSVCIQVVNVMNWNYRNAKAWKIGHCMAYGLNGKMNVKVQTLTWML